MANIAQLLTEHIDIWTVAESEKKSGRGRASANTGSVYGVKKLRELILELAVRGKLVPQELNDEPTSELLKRIQAEKAKLIADGKLKKEKPLTPISDDEKPFELPNGWEWVHLPDVTDYKVGKTPSTKSSVYWTIDNSGYNWVSIADLNHDGVVTETSKRVTQEAVNEVFKSEPVPTGTILMSFKLTLGKISILEVPAFHNEAIISIFPTGAIDKQYLFKVLPARANEGDSKSAIKGNTLNSESIAALLLPLPPLAEQHRIVAKVDELMKLCDHLEQQHSNVQEAHETLVSQLLATLTQSQSAAEFNANWQRIYAHFDVLFTTEASIDILKQTLLQLAVMGKLVPQDPFDEPASELLKRIQAEKAKLTAESKLKKEKPLAPIGEDEKPFELPIGWSWIYFGDYSVIERGGSPRPIQDYITNEESGLNWIKISDTSVNSKYITSTQEKIRKEGLVKTRMVYPGDFLLTNSMSFGRPYITKIQGCIHDGWLRIHPSEVMDKDFLYQLLMSPYVYGAFTQSAAGAVVQNLNADKVRELKIPIPPLAEQHRIVAKVDALMALCGQLKTRIQQANQQQQAIADALVAQAVA